ncbi:hypothetical protein [Parvimonas micra]
MKIRADCDVNCYLCINVLDHVTGTLNFIKEDNQYILNIKIKDRIKDVFGKTSYFYDKEIESIDIEYKGILKYINFLDLICFSEEIISVYLDDIQDLKINSIKLAEKNEVITNENYDFSKDKKFFKSFKKFLSKQFHLIFEIKLESEEVQE